MKKDNISGAKFAGRALADHALLAFYADNIHAFNYHVRRMHEDFSQLADALGYDVILRSAENQDEDEAA